MSEIRRVVRLGLTGALLAVVFGAVAACSADATGPEMDDNCYWVDGILICS